MKKLMIITVLMAMTMQVKAFKPWTKGGFETGKYRNVFVEMGYKKSQVKAKFRRCSTTCSVVPIRCILRWATHWATSLTSRITMRVLRVCRTA